MARFTNRAWKDLEALPPSLQTKVRAIARRLDEEPALGIKLKNRLEGNRSISVGRSHRLIYSVDGSGIIVKVIRGRKDVYR